MRRYSILGTVTLKVTFRWTAVFPLNALHELENLELDCTTWARVIFLNWIRVNEMGRAAHAACFLAHCWRFVTYYLFRCVKDVGTTENFQVRNRSLSQTSFNSIALCSYRHIFLGFYIVIVTIAWFSQRRQTGSRAVSFLYMRQWNVGEYPWKTP